MKKLTILLIAVVVMITTLTGCTVRNTKDITERLQPDKLYESYEVKPANLKAQSKCPLLPTINIVNVETREEDYAFFNVAGTARTVNPKELTSAIVEYLKYGFKKSQIKVDSNSSKIIHVSFQDAKWLSGTMTIGADIKMKVTVPETKYSEIYEAKD